MDVTRESLHRGIAAAVFGNRVGDISHAVQSYVEANGFSVVRSLWATVWAKSSTRTRRCPTTGPPAGVPAWCPA